MPRRTAEESIDAFTAQALSYCLPGEDAGDWNSRRFGRACLTEVLRLYRLALLLPRTPPEILPAIAHARWSAMRDNVTRRLVLDNYWKIFKPFEQEKPEPLMGSLSDDLADIRRDLSVGLEAIAGGTAKPRVVSHWRFSFETYWGKHAASATGALHTLCFDPPAECSGPPAALC